jgi:alkylation response protein AidB-like acyl-CoA dehydrogenase
LLVGPGPAVAVLASAERRAAALLAGEAVGVADRALELAVEHAKTRVQFDRPIGSYQAVAHQLANGYAELELARSLAYRAACTLADRTRPDRAREAEPEGRPGGVVEALACAAHACTGAAIEVCEVAIQVCGGIGVTWEFPLHRWYRRALWLQAFHAGRPDPWATIAGGLFGAAGAGAGAARAGAARAGAAPG